LHHRFAGGCRTGCRSLLENKGTHFESLLKLKAFLYTSIKNRYKSYLEHRKVQGKYKTYTETAQTFASEITENEVYAFRLQAQIELAGDFFHFVTRKIQVHNLGTILG